MSTQDGDADMEDLVNQVAERCISKLHSERVKADQKQIEQINTLLQHWSEQAFERTKELVSTISSGNGQESKHSPSAGFAENAEDMRDRQANLLIVSYISS